MERKELKEIFFRLSCYFEKAPWDIKFEIVDCMLRIYKAICPEGEKNAAKNTGSNNFIDGKK